MTTFDRPTGVKGRVMDRDKLAKAIAEVRSAQTGKQVLAEEIYVLPCIMLQRGTKHPGLTGTTAIVNREGVGDHNDEDSDIHIHFTFGINGMMIWWIDLDTEYAATMVTDEEVDLADFVRNHNHRTESNFSIWYNWAKKFEKVSA